MLLSLNIENYALIHSCKINFNDGFTAITGETGSGKTIMLGAIALVLGGRADVQVLSDKQKKCVIEAVFSIKDDLKPLFIDNDLDYDEQSVFRREITPQGKSRAFINDTPVALSVMRLFADHLIDIHSQSSTIKLKDTQYQLEIVDNLLDNNSILKDYQQLYHNYKYLVQTIAQKKQQQSEFLKELSYNQYLYDELKKADLKEEEQQEEENQLELFSHSEQIKDNLAQCIQLFDNDQISLLNILSQLSSLSSKISKHNPKLLSIYERICSAEIELKDIYSEISSFYDTIDFDEKKMQLLSDRLNLIYDLQKKHNVSTIKELKYIEKDLENKIQSSENISFEIEDLEKKQVDTKIKLENLCHKLHNQRIKASKELVDRCKPLLENMAMKDATLEVKVEPLNDFNSFGKDKIEFLFNANKTQDNKLNNLSSVISGGELSRLMLSIKAVISDKLDLPTMIFDEIDTGISGDIASKTADIMRLIAKSHQVIVITHLVQMAAKADNQYKVYKQVIDSQTQSNIVPLTDEQRVEEIAKMISSDKVTPQAIENAKTLLLRK